MILKRGEILDFWEERLGTPYYLYFLIDPRKDEVCYVGLTKQDFKKRLLQHKNPKASNEASIAKLQRHLKKQGLTLGGEIVAKGSRDFIEVLEKWTITGFWKYMGKNSIKNHQIGGFGAFGQAPESKRKAWETIAKRKAEGKYEKIEGEKSSSSKITEKDVLDIYDLIKKFYSNKEILRILPLNIGITGLCQIRNGNNWNYLFKRENMINIPSMNVVEGALKSQEKLQVLSLVEDGKTNKEIQLKYKVRTTDLDRIRRRDLWKLAWNVYENFYKPLNK
jgi:hypothetical protein